MTWVDLDSDLNELFSDLRPPSALDERWDSWREQLHDPHPDADKWLAASPEERERMRPAMDAKLADFRARHTARLVYAQRRRRTKETQRKRMRAYRATPAGRAKNIAQCKAWRQRQRQRLKAAA